jgi:thioredoxin domain-containing protein 5
MLPLLFLACVLGQCMAGAGEAVTATNLDDTNFNNLVSSSPHFVMFFAPWCGHCKRLAPVWEELAAKHNKDIDSQVTIAKVDCTVATALCSAQDVTGYPTLKFFKTGAEKDDGVKYRGNRDAASLEKFIADKLGNEVPEEKPASPESAEPVVEKGLHILSSASFSGVVGKGDTFIKFYAPWCGHCKKLAPAWEELAQNLQSDQAVKIAKVDCTEHQEVCQEHEVRGYPTLAYFRNGQKLETYKGARSLAELTNFVTAQKANAGKDDTEDGKVPEPQAVSPVAKLDNDNFEEETKSGVAFVKFFAPWCGHCKRLAPTWEELAKKYKDNKGVVIGHVDCTAADNINRPLCDAQGVKGFPTLHIYKDGAKAEEYSGKRGLGELIEFVEKHLAVEVAKDEL